MVTSVLIVEDEPEFLRRFADAVTADAGLRLLGAVSTGRAGLAMLDAQPPDVMLVDLGLPDLNGVELIRHAAQQQPSCDVLVVTMFGDDQHVLSSIEAGATGYLLKDAGGDRIAAAIHELRAGGSPISPSIARRVLARFRIGAGAGSSLGREERGLAALHARDRDPAPGRQGLRLRHRRRAARHLAAHRRDAREEDLSQAGGAFARRGGV